MAVSKGWLLASVFLLSAVVFSGAFVPSLLSRPAVSQWNPLSELWQDPFRILEESPLSGFGQEIAQLSLTRVDWKETPQAHIIKIDVPGVRKDEVKIEYKGEVLTISGERKKEEVEKSDHWHRVERAVGKFVRQFRLPNGHMDAIKAELDSGVLVVTVPKVEGKAGEVKSVSIEGGGSGAEKKCVEGRDNVCKA